MNTHHTVNNIEFPAEDFKLLQQFYEAVFGWEFKIWSDNYLEFNDGNMVGGFAKDLKKGKNGPVVIVYSKDLEATKKSIEENGGKIIVETFEFPGGKRFHFTDPEDNELAVWSEV